MSAMRVQFVLQAGLVLAAVSGPVAVGQSLWGPGSTAVSVHAISGFQPYTAATVRSVASLTSSVYISDASTFNNGSLVASVTLPTGAVLESVEFDVYDDNPIGEIAAGIYICSDDPIAGPCSAVSSLTTGQPGWTTLSVPLATVVNNDAGSYYLDVDMPKDAGLTKLRRAVVRYHLEVAPAPAMATFNDMPTSDGAFQYVEAFSRAGITAGCSAAPPLYCPDAPVTRRQMAVFFAKALGLYWPN